MAVHKQMSLIGLFTLATACVPQKSRLQVAPEPKTETMIPGSIDEGQPETAANENDGVDSKPKESQTEKADAFAAVESAEPTPQTEPESHPEQETPVSTDTGVEEDKGQTAAIPSNSDLSPRQRARAQDLYHAAEKTENASDVKAALNMYLTACQMGFADACHRYGWHMEKRGNPANARNFYRVACEHGVMKSCNNLGWMAEQKHRYQEAKTFYDTGCRQNHSISCDNLKRLEHHSKVIAH